MELSTTIFQDPSFSLSGLPLTTEKANLEKSVLLPEIKAFPRAWSYEDRILVWLAPVFRADVEEYHSESGKPLSQLLQSHQIEHLDQTFLKRLSARLGELKPVKIGVVKMDVQINSVINLLTVTDGPTQKFNRIKHWICTCVCGNTKEVSDSNLKQGKPYSCGCVRKPVSEETRALLGERSAGHTMPEEAKAKISAANKGRKKPEGFTAWTPERRARMDEKLMNSKTTANKPEKA